MQSNGYIDATAMCASHNKKFNDYFRIASTQEFMEALSKEHKLPVIFNNPESYIPDSALVVTFRGGNGIQGTFIHPDIAVPLAMWLSPTFAIQVSKWIKDLITNGVVFLHGTASQTRNGKLLLWDALASEDSLAEMIFSFVVGVCGHQHLERDVPYVDLSTDKNRRLDFVERYSKIVRGYELKLKQFTTKDLITTLGEKSYHHILSESIHNLDRNNDRKYVRPVKFVLLSPVGISDEAKRLLELMPLVEFKSVQEYCLFWLRKAWLRKYREQHKELANKVLAKYHQLFSSDVLKKIEMFA